MSSKNYIKLLFSFIAATVILTSCGKEEVKAPRSMEQIQNEEGVPVQVREIGKEDLGTGLTFYSKLSGWKESSVHPLIPDIIEKINFKIGDAVSKGQVVMEFPDDNPQVQYEQAKAGLEAIEKTLKRAKNLLDIGEMSLQSYEQIEMQYKISKRNFEAMGQLSRIKAPMSGVIVSMPFRGGEYPDMTKPLFTVAQLDKMIAKINVSDTEISFLKKGQDAYINWAGKDYKGYISSISIAMDPMTQAFPVEITFNNPKRELRPGTTVELRINTYKNNDAIVIPRKCIQNINGVQYVYLAQGNKSVLREVNTGKESGLDIEIISGLNVGDKIIDCCFNLLENGRKIRVMNK